MLHAVLKAAVRDRLVASNPADDIDRPRVTERHVEPWTAEQVAAMRAALPERYAAMVDVGAGVGLRQGAVLGLAVTDVDFLRRVVHVRTRCGSSGSWC